MATTFPPEASIITATRNVTWTVGQDGVALTPAVTTSSIFVASISVISAPPGTNIATGQFLSYLGDVTVEPAKRTATAPPGDLLLNGGVTLSGSFAARSTNPTATGGVGTIGQGPTGTVTSTNTAGSNSTGSSHQSGTASPGSGNGPTAGAIAGAAIGCLIAGLLLGFVAAFLFLRRKKNRGGTSDESKAYLAAASETRFPLDKFLLDSSPDKEIASELHSLGTLIQQHVENNYHLQPVHEDPRVLSTSLVQLGLANGGSLTPDVLAQLALDPNTRHVALQHVISQVVFTSIDASSRSALSMLPAPVAAFLRSMPQTEAGEKSEVTSFALNQWRALSAFLLHPSRSQRTPLPTSSAAVTSQAAALSNALDTFLGYFVATDESSRSQQRSHLQAVIGEAAKLGYLLLSQPSEWRFVHALGQTNGGRVAVVCAGLVKTTDKDGTPYPAPTQVVPPQTVVL